MAAIPRNRYALFLRSPCVSVFDDSLAVSIRVRSAARYALAFNSNRKNHPLTRTAMPTMAAIAHGMFLSKDAPITRARSASSNKWPVRTDIYLIFQ